MRNSPVCMLRSLALKAFNPREEDYKVIEHNYVKILSTKSRGLNV